MTFRTLTLAALVASTAVGIGCTGGSSSSRGGTAAASTGNINSGLPTENRGAAYNTTTVFAPQGSIAGAKINAMAVATLGTATGVIASEAPFSNIYAVASSSNTFEAKLFFDANMIARVDSGATTDYYASTSSREAPGAGDVWQRVNNNWQLAYDTADNEAVVATVNSGAWTGFYVAHGSIDGSTTVVRQAAGGFTSIATIQSEVPTNAISYKGDLWIATRSSEATGGGAKLQRYTGGGNFDEVMMPVALVGQGVYQNVTSMIEIATASSGSVAMPILAVAVGEFNEQGAAISGTVMISNGTDFEVIANYQGEAPTSLAWIDDTVYVGTSGGKVQYRDANGEMQDESTLPANNGVYSLVVTGDELYIGAAINTGPAIFVRKGGAGVTPPPPPSTDVYFDTDVAPLLAANCASCHQAPGLALAVASFELVDNATDFTEITTNRIDMATPTDSMLLLKASADTSVGGHGGGAIWAPGSSQANTVTTWISQGARQAAVVTPPPPPPVLKTFSGNVHPLLQADCMGCHAGTGNGLQVNANVTTSYNSALARVNLGTPEASLLLTKPSGTNHGGGAIANYNVGGVKYNEIIQWIADGAGQ